MKLVPVFAFAAIFAVTACSKEAAVEEGTELTPADTAMTTPPPAMDEGMGGMEGDSMGMDTGDAMADSASM